MRCLSSQLSYILQSFFSLVLLPSHLTSCTANKSVLYSWVTWIRVWVHCFYIETARSTSPLVNPCSSWVIFVVSILFPILEASQQTQFYGVGLSVSCPTPNLERVSLFVWVITTDLSGMGVPAISYTAASIAFRIIWSWKHHHYVRVGIPSRGSNIEWYKI